ncbi:TonB-dependent hemoglobin/transferrin/lactoferrin family receptor [Lichenihabitans psoromatis]|uniref:TonB-dependent hemoglobin/transferrin/lactoferrin family receptor n=1 Tax=Lichenihabitans psoromatis TaxID=2528642 RepID=UPI0010382FDC|nr:TonB-dependent hemoglobin/transferrin/lactoferrin family receptor [Lichenihabitans psoromatis]
MGSRTRAVAIATATFLVAAQGATQAYGQQVRRASDATASATNATPADLSAAVALDTITVTSTKTPEPAIDALSGSTVVTRPQIDRLQPSKVSEILQTIPGVTTQSSQNDPGQSVNIRGLQDFGRVNVLVDGARQEYQISGHNANGTYYLDPEFIGQVDVTRGPVSNIYGSGAIGGVVAFRTKGVEDVLAPDETYGALQKVGVGSNGAEFLNSSAVATRFGDVADFYGQFVYRGLDPYDDGAGDKVPDTGSRLLGGLMKANIRPAEGQQISLSAMQQNYTFANNGTSAAGSRFRDDVTAENYTIGYTFSRPEIQWLDFSAKAYSSATRNKETAVAPDATYQALGVQPGDPLSDRVRTVGFDLNNTARFDTGPVHHALTVGGDSAWDHVRTDDQAGGYVGALTPSGTRRISGAFIQDEARYGGWLRVLGAARYDDYELNGGAYHSEGSRVSPKITVGVTPIRGIELYSTYAEGYRAPSITETLISGAHPFPAFNILPNPTLRPEVAHNVEGGVNVKYDDVFRDGDKVRGKLTVFSNDVSNYIDMETVGAPYLVPFIPGAPVSLCASRPSLCFPITSYQYLNIAKANLTGVEVEGGYDWGQGFFTLSGQHIDAKNETTKGALVTSIPDRLTSTLGLRFLDDRLTVGTRLTLVDKSVVISSATGTVTNTPSGGYALVDLFANYKVNDRVAGDFTVKNLFDRQYRQYLDSEPSAGTVVKASLTVKFASK